MKRSMGETVRRGTHYVEREASRLVLLARRVKREKSVGRNDAKHRRGLMNEAVKIGSYEDARQLWK